MTIFYFSYDAQRQIFHEERSPDPLAPTRMLRYDLGAENPTIGGIDPR